MTICPELAARYHESFGAEVTDVMTCPPFAVHPYTEPGRDALHRCPLTYMGNLGCGRGQPPAGAWADAGRAEPAGRDRFYAGDLY